MPAVNALPAVPVKLVKAADAVAVACGCSPEMVLLASTGVIGEPRRSYADQSSAGDDGKSLPASWDAAAEAIRTTDTFAKGDRQQPSLMAHQSRLRHCQGRGWLPPIWRQCWHLSPLMQRLTPPYRARSRSRLSTQVSTPSLIATHPQAIPYWCWPAVCRQYSYQPAESDDAGFCRRP